MLITRASRSGKTNLLFILSHQPDIDKISLYAKNPQEEKYHLVIKKWESIDLKPLLNTQIIWMIFIKTLRNIIWIKHKNFDSIWLYDSWYA